MKYLLAVIILFFLFAPIIQYNTDLFLIKPLHGVYAKKEDAKFSWSGWFSGAYQQKKEEYENENFGFRNTLVRFNHQLAFVLFKEAKANQAIVGKDNFIYEKPYIDAYYGRDFMGRTKITEYIHKLEQIQDAMQKKGKLFLLIFAPGKATFYSEYIPDHLRGEKGPTNYGTFAVEAAGAGINVIDFNSDFLERKYTSPYPLYPQFGIHWSNYGVIHAFDSICSHVEKKLNKNLPDIKFTGLEVPDTLREPDDDLIRGMNLLYYPTTVKMAYPQFEVVYDSVKHTKLNSVVISDSFWWQVYNSLLHTKTFNQYDFWYYNKEIYPDFFYSPLYIERTNYFRRLNNANVIMMVFTEPTLAKFGCGFVDLCYETFCQPADSFKINMLEIKENMIKNKEWYTHLEKKSIEQNISLDSVINRDAMFYYNTHHAKK